MSLRLLLLRHGETAWNRERRYQGWTDTPLSTAGLQQAEAAARELKEHPLVAVYSSPLQRARETAAIIASVHGLDVVTDPAFKELGFGEWEGLTLDEARAGWPRATARQPSRARGVSGRPRHSRAHSHPGGARARARPDLDAPLRAHRDLRARVPR